MDFSNAFDSVNHELLIHKCNIRGSLLNWITAYLRGRCQRVIIEGKYSPRVSYISGVPQGSILGPLQFTLFVNDITLRIIASSIALFADDAKCHKQIRTINDCVLLHNDFINLYERSITWKMTFNASKCKVLSIGRYSKPCILIFYKRLNVYQRLGFY